MQSINVKLVFKPLITLALLLSLIPGASYTVAENEDGESYTTVIVTFPLAEGISLQQAKGMFEASAPTYKTIPGLIRKYYLYGEGPLGGGVYFWESRAAAEKLYTQAWINGLASRVGAQPTIQYFYSPVVINNQ